MEATIQSNNKAINIDALKANIQRGLQAIKQCVLAATKQATKVCCNVGAWTLPSLYRKELKVARAIAKAMDARSALVNGMMTAMVAWFIYYVYMYY